MNTAPAELRFTLGDRMRKAMLVAGISSSAMAERFGVTPQTISRWFSSQTRPKMGLIIGWAEVTNVPLDWLLTDEQDDQADVA